jgi:hypothetical protein
MKWHTHSAGQKAGPFSIEELRAKMASGQLTGEIFVWREGFPAWKKLTEVPELSSLLAPAPPVAEAPPDFPSLEAAPAPAADSMQPILESPPGANEAEAVSKAARKSGDLSVFIELPKAANEKTGVIDTNLLKDLKKEAQKVEKIVQQQSAIQTAKVTAQHASARKQPRSFKKVGFIAGGLLVLAGGAVGTYYVTLPKAPTLPVLPDVEPIDYQHLQAAVSQPIDQSGVHLEIVKSTDDLAHPHFYLATNLPDPTAVDVTIKQVAGTAIEPSSAPIVIHLNSFLNHLAKTEKVTVSEGEYTVTVTGGPSKTPFAAARFFLGGTRDANYQNALAQARTSRRAKAEAEMRDINQGMAQLDTFQILLQKLSDLSKSQPINQKVLNAFHEIERTWDEAESNLASRSEFWKPEVLEATVVYPRLLQLGRDSWKDLKATNEIFKKFFGTQPAERPALMNPLSEQTARATQNIVLLKAELEKTHPGDIQ